MAGAVTPEEKNAIVDFLNSKAKTKSKFYFNDFLPLFPDTFSMIFCFIAIFHVLHCTYLNFLPFSDFLAIFHV